MHNVYYGDELYHYGILGQKWGVRRYQNFDGSLTQEGLKRYREAESNYTKRKKEYKSIKNDKNSSYNSKQLAKAKMKKAKQEMNQRYKNLKVLKKADKGKIRYYSGERITGRKAVTSALAAVGTMSISAAAYIYRNNKAGGHIMGRNSKFTDADLVNALSAIGGLALGSSMVKGYIDEIPNNELRAYYNHPTVRK